jgi:hypothetical protein
MRTTTRWILTAAIVLVTAGCRREIDVSTRPEYGVVMGHVFETKGDFILFKFQKEDREIHLEEPGSTYIPKLSELPGKFPYEYEGKIIFGVLPKGSRFRIVQVREVHSPGAMGYVTYKAELLNFEKYKGTLIDPTWLASGGVVPKFDPKLVEEVLGSGK